MSEERNYSTRSQFRASGGRKSQIELVLDKNGKQSVRISSTGGNLISKDKQGDGMPGENDNDTYFSKIPNVYFPSEETEPFCAGNYAQAKNVPGNHPISYSGFN